MEEATSGVFVNIFIQWWNLAQNIIIGFYQLSEMKSEQIKLKGLKISLCPNIFVWLLPLTPVHGRVCDEDNKYCVGMPARPREYSSEARKYFDKVGPALYCTGELTENLGKLLGISRAWIANQNSQ